MSYPPASRLVGVDAARGLAVLGMVAAHLAHTEPFDWAQPASWTDLVNGRSSILFALLAGVSLAIMTGRECPVAGRALGRARIRILVRALVLFGLGLLLSLPPTNIAVILHYYAVYFVLALPLLRLRARALLPLAAAIGALMPLALAPLERLPLGALPELARFGLDLLATGYYPALLWLAFVLAGLGIGRMRLDQTAVQWALLASGAALAALGYTAAAVIPGATAAPHSGSSFEAIGSGGVAIAVLGLCLMADRGIRMPLLPIAATGSIALTAYTGQLLAIGLLQLPVPGEPGSLLWLWFSLAVVVLCTAWALTLGKGPLERGLSWLADRAAGVPRAKAPAGPLRELDTVDDPGSGSVDGDAPGGVADVQHGQHPPG